MTVEIAKQIGDALDRVEQRIQDACHRAGRDRGVITLIAVSKLQSVEKMVLLAAAARARGLPIHFGENYVQEFKAKHANLTGPFETHLIGPLQSNKSREAVGLFDVIQTVHTERLAKILDGQAAKVKKLQRVFLQVNISSDDQKSGVPAENVDSLYNFIRQQCPALSCEGLMTITALYEKPEMARSDFARLRELGRALQVHDSTSLQLSMGMSADFDIAIEEGATMVRVGTALFGERSVNHAG